MPSFQADLQALYHDIHACHLCPAMDPYKALRRTEAVDPGMDTFILSQALAKAQLRKSGVSFFTAQGTLGSAGRNLEKFLNQFGRTVYPPREIRLDSGDKVPAAAPPYISVYNTELTRCYPGKGRTRGDRPPTADEITACLRQQFLEHEIALVRPRLLLLMGDASRTAFCRYVLEAPRRDTLQAHLDEIVRSGSLPTKTLAGVPLFFLPIQHASGANPHFYAMLDNAPLIALIRHALAQS